MEELKQTQELWSLYSNGDGTMDQVGFEDAIKQDRERTIKLIKEKRLHLGYANDIINLLQTN